MPRTADRTMTLTPLLRRRWPPVSPVHRCSESLILLRKCRQRKRLAESKTRDVVAEPFVKRVCTGQIAMARDLDKRAPRALQVPFRARDQCPAKAPAPH